jgi:NAD(P)H dehydrogenase (quinone)
MEECVLIDQDALNNIIIPTTNVDRLLPDGTRHPEEVINKSQIYITTAGWKNSFAYSKLIELLIQSIIMPDSAMVLGGTYETPVTEGLLDEDFVNQSKGIVIGSPSYCMLMTPDMHKWLLESAMHLELAGKLGGAFSTVQYTHGGGECVIQSILLHEMDYGMLCYSGGSSWGTPYIHIGPVGVNNNVESHNTLEYYRDNFEIYGNRFARKAAELFAGQVGQ